MDYRDWKAWQRSVDLAVDVFLVLRDLSGPETYAFCDQARRAALSVPNNVAEALGRFSYRDQRQFVIRARGSLLELETEVEIGRRLKIIQPRAVEALFAETAEVGRLLNGVIRFMSRQERAGKPKKPSPRRGRELKHGTAKPPSGPMTTG